MKTTMKAIPVLVFVVVVIAGCGLINDEPEPTVTPVPPEVTVEEGGGVSISYECDWVLYTYYSGHEVDYHAALQHLQDEMNALLPPEYRALQREQDFDRTREWMIETVLSCEWQREKADELAKLSDVYATRAVEQEKEFQRMVQEWKARNEAATPK